MADSVAPFIEVALVIMAVSSVAVTVVLYWLAKSLISSSVSLNKLIETVDYNVHTTVDMLQKSIDDINVMTRRVGDNMDKLDSIVENVDNISSDVRSSMHMIDKTVVPTLTNLHSISAGARKAIETWNEYGGTATGAEEETDNKK